MLIVVCGMHRSGSTLVAQLVKGLLGAQSKPVTISANGLGDTVAEMQARAADPDHIWLVKVHQQARRFREGMPDEGALYLYTYRDMRDALASAWRKNRLQVGDAERSPDTLQEFIRSQIRSARVFEARKNIWIGRYENFVHNLEGLAVELAQALNIDASPSLINTLTAAARPEEQRKRVRQLKGGDKTIRAGSFITSNHITDGREGAWKETLTVAEAQRAECLAQSWLKAKGYELYFRRDLQDNVRPLKYRLLSEATRSQDKRPSHRRWWPFSARS